MTGADLDNVTKLFQAVATITGVLYSVAASRNAKRAVNVGAQAVDFASKAVTIGSQNAATLQDQNTTLAEHTADIKEVKINTNGMTTQLQMVAHAAGVTEGHACGVADEQIREAGLK